MANVITLSIKTEAPYSEAEKLDLLEAFVQFIGETDSDVIEDSESLSIVPEGEVDTERDDDIREQAVENFMKSARIRVEVQIADENDATVRSISMEDA